MKSTILGAALLLAAGVPLAAQASHAAMGAAPASTASGQAAFGAISEVVKVLKADPATDWSKVNIEALRQHLIDMDEVILRSTVISKNVPSGVELTVTGTGRTATAIRRMLTSHVSSLSDLAELTSSVRALDNGVVMTVTARSASDTATIARIRGLGFAGLLAEGDHHARHHLMLARGQAMDHR